MTMPVDLVLVRHGESEGNVAVRRSKRGDTSLYTEEFCARHSYSWRLTDKGLAQAKMAGAWIREHIGPAFDRYYCSEFVRAMETAALLDLEGARWRSEFYLRERNYGGIDVMPPAERFAKYGEIMARRSIDDLFWTPPHGESMADLCLRVERFFDTLHRECADKRVIVVCHGEVMWAFRVRLERMNRRVYKAFDASTHPFDRIHNCQVLHYTRRDPADGQLSPRLDWFRSICPTDLRRSRNDWEKVTRPTYGNEDLLAEVALHPRIVGGDPPEES